MTFPITFPGGGGISNPFTEALTIGPAVPGTALTLAGGVLTGASAPVLNMTQAWNNGATTFTGIKLDVTNTASAAASLLIDLQVGGVSQLRVTRQGVFTVANSITAGSHVTTGGSLIHGTSGTSINMGTGDGIITLYNNGSTAFNRLQFGGTSSSFPSLKRNSTFVETKLADDSAYAPHAMQYLDVTDGITAPGSSAGRARIYVDTADGDLKVVFGDGTVKTIVVDT